MNFFEFDITIVGGGCVGASILHELTRRGYGNVGLIDHGRATVSATSNSGGMLRVFHEHSEHVRLALGSHTRLKALQQSGVLTENPPANGSLYFFNKARYERYKENLELMNGAEYPFEVYTTVCGRKYFPQFRWGDDEWAIYEPLGSALSPRVFSENLIAAGTRAGATVIDGFEVQRLSRYRDHYRISAADATVTTNTLILAGGARLLPRLRDLGLSLPLEAKTLSTFSAEKTRKDVLPNYLDRETLDFACLGRGTDLTFANAAGPRTLDRYWLEPYKKTTAEDCYAPNRIGYSGQVAGLPQLSLATGWGGTGFKFALEVGQRVAGSIERHSPGRTMYALS